MRRLHLSAALLVLVTAVATAGELRGKVVGVMDGDTIDVLTAEKSLHRIRLEGIDAPEKRQPFGQAAKGALSDAVFAREVKVVWHKQDRYQRIIGKVLVDADDVGLALVRSGYAWHYKRYETEQTPVDRITYASAELLARGRGRGLWTDSYAQAPWDFRASRRK